MRIAVIGAGVVGLSTAKSLIDDGNHEVRCYESATPMAGRSVGDTRVFRVTHAEPELVELSVRARHAWDDWSSQAGTTLVGREGQLRGGQDLDTYLVALQSASVPAEIVESTELLAPLTSQHMDGPFVYDPWAGVIRAAETGRFLLSQCESVLIRETVQTIDASENSAVVSTANSSWSCDSVVIAAGRNTARLASTCGMHLPIEELHTARFTFRMKDANAVVPNWFETYEQWSAWGLTTRPGHWAMGIHWQGEPNDIAIPQSVSTAARRDQCRAYIAARLDQLDPEPVDFIECFGDAGGDGINAERRGPVVALWGDNLFKFAPVIGAALGDAAISQELPNLPLANK